MINFSRLCSLQLQSIWSEKYPLESHESMKNTAVSSISKWTEIDLLDGHEKWHFLTVRRGRKHE